MKKLYINEILYAVNGELLSGFDGTLIDSVSINSREIKNGALFVPIKGENVDGHKFIEEAFAAGAVATLTSEHNSTESDKIYIKVPVKNVNQSSEDYCGTHGRLHPNI